MKKVWILIFSLGICLFLSACTNETTSPTASDYKPMIYVQETLYGDTGKTIGSLPNNTISIGTIQKQVPQDKPMVEEDFTSNTFLVGSEVFSNESEHNTIYVKLSDGKYAVYETIE